MPAKPCLRAFWRGDGGRLSACRHGLRRSGCQQRALRERGAKLLDIPANYYEDLGARFGFDDEALVGLEQGHLLYDEDASGNRFHQLYSRAVDRRFFFEFVQRDAGYTGYGAPNAGVRLAAQARFRPAEPVD
jgi:4-hydroxyphenylpyruvate dioxygenase